MGLKLLPENVHLGVFSHPRKAIKEFCDTGHPYDEIVDALLMLPLSGAQKMVVGKQSSQVLFVTLFGPKFGFQPFLSQIQSLYKLNDLLCLEQQTVNK